MKPHWIGIVLRVALFLTIAIAGFGQAVHYLWNWLMPALFGLPALTFWQAVGLLALSWVLFGGWRGFRGPGHRDTLSVRDELAAAYQAAGEAGMAIRMLTRTLADRERLPGPRSADIIITRDRLAAAYLAEGKIKDAISHYKRALSDCEKVLGHGHPDTIATSANLAAAYEAAGRMPTALQLSEQTCAESERVLGPDHADTLARLANLAHLYDATGRVGDAIAVLRETAARCERLLPSGDPRIQAVQHSLADIAGDG